MRGDRAVPISHYDHSNAGTLCGFNIGGAVADHDRTSRLGAEGRQRLANMAGMGLHLVDRVAREHRLDVMVDIKVGEQAARGAVPPVGADGERDAGVAQALDRGDDCGKGRIRSVSISK